MNEYGILTTKKEIEKHEAGKYNSFSQEGIYHLRLDCRYWYTNRSVYGLVCCFTDIDACDKHWQGFCFKHTVNGEEIYCPKDGSVNMREAEDGTVWDITIRKTPRGKYTMESAKQIA